VDESAGKRQSYVEDCQVCCKPNVLRIAWDQWQEAYRIESELEMTIEQIRVIGNRRIPKETVLARSFTHPGDTYDPISIERDFNSLWNTGYFEDLRIEREDSEKGVILNIYRQGKAEYPRDQLQGPELRLDSPTCSTASRRRRCRSRSRASTTRPRSSAPTTVLKELLAEHGHQFATIKTEVKTFRRPRCRSTSTSRKARRSKVGKIKFTGNSTSAAWCCAAR
jgi:outer membrane protein insertion porin family